MCDFTCWFQVVLSKMLGSRGISCFMELPKSAGQTKFPKIHCASLGVTPWKLTAKWCLAFWEGLFSVAMSNFQEVSMFILMFSLLWHWPEVFWCVALGILQQLPFWCWQQLSVAHWNLHCLPWIRPLSWRAACSVGHGWYQHGSVKPS